MPGMYQWRKGGEHRHGVSAQVVGGIIDNIRARNGVCHPGMLVDEARQVASPIHELFEWDDDEAADAWRVHQARQIIANIEVVVEGNGPVVRGPAFVHVDRYDSIGDRTPGYLDIESALADPEYRQQVLENALSTLASMERRYGELQELAVIWRAVNRVRRELERKQKEQSA